MEEVVAQTQQQSDNDDDEKKERREAEFERATMTRKQAEFTVKLQVNSPPTNLRLSQQSALLAPRLPR